MQRKNKKQIINNEETQLSLDFNAINSEDEFKLNNNAENLRSIEDKRNQELIDIYKKRVNAAMMDYLNRNRKRR